MPDLSHLWQRFVLALALVLGLGVGVAATIFGYSNTDTVTVGFALWHVSGVPLWSVAIVPLGVALVVATLYQWWKSLRHFTEGVQHRRHVRDLESEVAALKEHLDHLLEMPDHGATPKPAPSAPEPEPAEMEPAEIEPAAAVPAEPAEPAAAAMEAPLDETEKPAKQVVARRRFSLKRGTEPEPAATATNGEHATATPGSSEEANS